MNERNGEIGNPKWRNGRNGTLKRGVMYQNILGSYEEHKYSLFST
jgi:hypothetical protein